MNIMSESSVSLSIENDKQTKTGLVILGRGIELGTVNTKDKYGVLVSSKRTWRPTSLVEKVTRTGKRRVDISKDDEDVVIGGANANVLATAQLVQEMKKNGQILGVIIAAAGRPPYLQPYLENYPNLSEGRILFERLSKKVDLKSIPHEILEENVDSIDDIIVAHQRALKEGINKLIFVTVNVHAPRVRDLIDLVKVLEPSFSKVVSEVVESESILGKRSKKYAKIIQDEIESSAYQRTWEREQNGRRQLREGTYSFKSQSPLIAKYPAVLRERSDIFSQALDL